MQSPGWQPTLCLAWCLIWWFASLEKVWSYLALNTLSEARCHITTQTKPILILTRSTQRAQTSLAEADHYSHIAHCKNVEPWWWKTTPPLPPHPPKKKKKKKKLDHYLHHDLGMPPLWWCFHAHLLILEYPDHHQNVISSSLYYPGPLHKISSQSVQNFLSNIVHRQTNKQTDKPTLPKT